MDTRHPLAIVMVDPRAQQDAPREEAKREERKDEAEERKDEKGAATAAASAFEEDASHDMMPWP